MVEMIDVLNENGVKTGEIVSRDVIHKEGLWHRAVVVCIINSDNEMLMQQRSEKVWEFPGLWDLSVAAHVMAGDDSVSTILRETNEEIGVQIGYTAQAKDFRFLSSFRNSMVIGDIIENQFYELFILRRDINIKDICFTDDEVADVQWIKYSTLKAMQKEGKLHPRVEWVDEVVKYINKF